MRWGAILVVIYVVYQVVSWVLSNAAQKQTLQRRSQATSKPRTSSPATPARSSFQWSSQQPAPSGQRQVAAPMSPERHAEELAARRSAQLEELRRRRQDRSSTPSTTQTRMGSRQVSHQPTMHRTAVQSSSPIQTGHFAEAEALRRQAAKAQLHSEKLALQRGQEEAAVRSRKAEARLRDARNKESRARAIPVLVARHLHPHDRQRMLLRDRATLRDLFVAKELLDRPVSLRTSPEVEG